MRLMSAVQHQKIAGVVSPAESSDHGRLFWQDELFGIGVKIGRLYSELGQKFVRIFDLQIVVLLILHQDQPASILNEASQRFDVSRRDMMRGQVSIHGLIA